MVSYQADRSRKHGAVVSSYIRDKRLSYTEQDIDQVYRLLE
jgi:hypothetical protein